MPKLKTLAPAKINLTFDILGALPDGYHEVETLLQAIDLSDMITFDIEKSSELSIEICAPGRIDFPDGRENLIHKAASLFAQHTEKSFRLSASVVKNIPIGAGLAGGSADAAGTLVALNHSFGNVVSDDELYMLAAKLGADVPFCISGGTRLGVGRGDKLLSCQSSLSFTICVVKPLEISVSTPWAYQRFDECKLPLKRPQTSRAWEAMQNGELLQAMDSFANVFEPVIFEEFKVLAEIKQALLKNGAWHVQLSGSGPALFAIVGDVEQAHFIRNKIMQLNGVGIEHRLEFHICESIKTGIVTTAQ